VAISSVVSNCLTQRTGLATGKTEAVLPSRPASAAQICGREAKRQGGADDDKMCADIETVREARRLAVERMAAALTGEAVETLGGKWYGRGDANRLARDGESVARVPCESDHHPDPVAKASTVALTIR
jgi:hypothetical protein